MTRWQWVSIGLPLDSLEKDLKGLISDEGSYHQILHVTFKMFLDSSKEGNITPLMMGVSWLSFHKAIYRSYKL